MCRNIYVCICNYAIINISVLILETMLPSFNNNKSLEKNKTGNHFKWSIISILKYIPCSANSYNLFWHFLMKNTKENWMLFFFSLVISSLLFIHSKKYYPGKPLGNKACYVEHLNILRSITKNGTCIWHRFFVQDSHPFRQRLCIKVISLGRGS